MMNIDLNNPEMQNALQIVQFTRHSLFLTGKAGTGKSTFLRYIAATTKKKHVILAPTGAAQLFQAPVPPLAAQRQPVLTAQNP